VKLKKLQQYGVPELIFYQLPPRIHALLLWKPYLKEVLWHKIIFPQTRNSFNKLLWEIFW